jgi:hypothetical protein
MANLFEEVFGSLFGSTDESAQQAQIDANLAATALIQKRAKEAREDVLALGELTQAGQRAGFQSVLDILGQAAPQQFGAFQQGNVGAQQALLAGLPQIQNALLGQPVNLAALQPQTIGFSTDFAQQQLPAFGGVTSVVPRARNAPQDIVNPALPVLPGAGDANQGGFGSTIIGLPPSRSNERSQGGFGSSLPSVNTADLQALLEALQNQPQSNTSGGFGSGLPSGRRV